MYGDTRCVHVLVQASMRAMYWIALENVSERRKTQDSRTEPRVKTRENVFQAFRAGPVLGSERKGFRVDQTLCVAKARPCSPPQSTKPQVAPCQRPQMS